MSEKGVIKVEINTYVIETDISDIAAYIPELYTDNVVIDINDI